MKVYYLSKWVVTRRAGTGRTIRRQGRKKVKLSAAVLSVTGTSRKINQDNLYLDGTVRPLKEQEYSCECKSAGEIQIYSVCDGMGGEQAGEEASYRAVKALAKQFSNHGDDWKYCVMNANESVCKLCRKRNIRAGTTFSGIFFHGNRCTAVNVGDSSIYFISGNTIRQISLDHTRFQMLADAGLIDRNDMSYSKARSELTQYLGIEREVLELEPHVEYLDTFQCGDMILLCSIWMRREDRITVLFGREHLRWRNMMLLQQKKRMMDIR